MKSSLFSVYLFFYFLGNITTYAEEDFLYRISEGDTIFNVAQLCKIKTDELLNYNKMSRASIVKIGQVIKIPKDYKLNCLDRLTKKKQNLEENKDQNISSKEKNQKSNQQHVIKAQQQDKLKNNNNVKINKTDNNSSLVKKYNKCFSFRVEFIPTEGQIYDTFGTESVYSTGIIIKAEKDLSPVKAVEDGKVIFKGNNISMERNNSKLIVISHKNNYFTGYGIQSEEIFVKEGDRVKKGQIIANVDLTIDPNLFFTIRTKDGLVCNPLEIIKGL